MLRSGTWGGGRSCASGLALALVLLAARGAAQEASKTKAFFGKEELSRQVTLHEKGCKKGDAGECFNLALAYQQGLGGTAKDEAKAATFFQKTRGRASSASRSKPESRWRW
jgi:TPR repeat protein